MTPAQPQAKLDELRALPGETEWVELKHAERKYDLDDLGKYFSALINEANLKGQAFGWLDLWTRADATERATSTPCYQHAVLPARRATSTPCYQHAVLRYICGNFMTNASLRQRFGIEEKNSAKASRLIKDAISVGLIKLHVADVRDRDRKYVPFWADPS
jgi:hypothetical protein